MVSNVKLSITVFNVYVFFLLFFTNKKNATAKKRYINKNRYFYLIEGKVEI